MWETRNSDFFSCNSVLFLTIAFINAQLWEKGQNLFLTIARYKSNYEGKKDDYFLTI